ncbi:MAG: glycosyltransferase family 2 protein [Bacteroidota bacterium]
MPSQSLPKVTIIIGTFNRAELLKTAITGGLIQDYPNLEILITDNASTDNTRDVVEEFQRADERIKYYRNDTNIGASENYKRAFFNLADSDWAMFVSDDDYLTDPRFISDGMNAILLNGEDEVAFYQSGVETYYETTNTRIEFVPNIEEGKIFEPKEYFLEYFNINFFSFTTTLFNRKAILEEESDEILSGSDVFLMLILSLRRRVILSKKICGVYMVHNAQNYGRSNFKNYLSLFKATYIEILNFALERRLLPKEKLINWLDSAIRHFQLNIEGWLSGLIKIQKPKPPFYFSVPNWTVNRIYYRLDQYIHVPFAFSQVNNEEQRPVLKVYLPGIYYHLYWKLYSLSQRIKLKNIK